MLTRTLVLTILIFGLAISQDQKKYGKEITLHEKTKISAILHNPSRFNGKRVVVEGKVVDVCREQGCWISIAANENADPIRFKVEDGVIVFPVSAKGKKVTAQGILSVKSLSKNELIAQGMKHARESGKEFDTLTVKGPKTVVQIEGEGAIIE